MQEHQDSGAAAQGLPLIKPEKPRRHDDTQPSTDQA